MTGRKGSRPVQLIRFLAYGMSPRRVVMAATSLAYARLARGACPPRAPWPITPHAPSAPRPWPSCVSGMSAARSLVKPVSERPHPRRQPLSPSPIAAKAVTGLARPSVEPSRNVHEGARQQWPCRGESGSEARSRTRERARRRASAPQHILMTESRVPSLAFVPYSQTPGTAVHVSNVCGDKQ